MNSSMKRLEGLKLSANHVVPGMLRPVNGSKPLKPRVAAVLRLLRDFRARAVLDVGCGDGSITVEVARAVGAEEVYCVEISERAAQIAASRGIKVFVGDVSRDPIPLSSESVDLAVALDVIEHLLNPDHMLREVRRVIKPSGLLVVSTVNLGNWLNRLIFLLGYQPYYAEVSTEVLAGVPWRYKRPSGDIRSFTLRALIELLEHHGFQVVRTVGVAEGGPLNRAVRLLDKLFALRPSLARQIVVAARRP